MWKRISHRAACSWLAFLLVLTLFGDVLSNGRPLYCRIDQRDYFPGIGRIRSGSKRAIGVPVLDSIRLNDAWKTYPYAFSMFALVPYSADEWSSDPAAYRLPPGARHPRSSGRFRHWLGTDARGRDVAAGLISGARIAVITGTLATGLSLVLGILLGSLAGFWGDDRLRLSKASLLALLVFTLLLTAYLCGWQYTLPGGGLAATGRLVLMAGAAVLVRALLYRRPWFASSVSVPVDMLIMRLSEVIESVPRLMLIIAIAALFPGQTVWTLIALIGLFGWTSVGQVLRAELIRIREMAYIQSAESIGLSRSRMLIRHVLPNALPAIWIIATFSVAAAILLEASLAFLGYGSGTGGTLSWGSMLNQARQYPADWWVSVFPGSMIALTLMSLYRIGNP